MQPSLDQLIQIARTLAHDNDFVRVVLASTQGEVQGDVQFIEVSDGCPSEKLHPTGREECGTVSCM